MTDSIHKKLIAFLEEYISCLASADGNRFSRRAARRQPHLFEAAYEDFFAPLLEKLAQRKSAPRILEGNCGKQSHLFCAALRFLEAIDYTNLKGDPFGDVYSSFFLSRTERKKRTGSFFTPGWIIDYILAALPLDDLSRRPDFAAIDLACGSGAFLMRLAAKLGRRPQRRWLFGIDVDLKALKICDVNLRMQSATANDFTLVNADSIELFVAVNDAAHPNHSLAEAIFSREYDLVLGNPPYGAHIPADLKPAIKSNFSTAFGKFESYRLFLEMGVASVGEGGHLGFIVPNTWLTIAQAAPLRQMILDTCSIIELVLLPPSVFDASVDTAIVVLKKGKPRARHKMAMRLAPPSAKRDASVIGSINPTFVPQPISSSGALAIITAHSGSMPAKIIDKIERGSTPLGSFAKIAQGLIPYDRHRGHRREQIEGRIWHASHQKDETYVRELSGRDISAYAYRWNGKRWLSYGPWLAAPREERFFNEPRILIQSTRNLSLKRRIVACYCDERFVNTTVINNLLLDSGAITLEYILAVLNSKLMSWYYAHKYPTTIHVYPAQLRRLPFHEPEGARLQTVSLAARNVIDALAASPAGDSRSDRLLANIDRIVYLVYGLSEAEIALVERYFSF